MQLFADVPQNFWFSQTSLENTCAWYKVNLNVWFYAFNLHLYYEKRHSSFPVSSEDISKKNVLLEHSWTRLFYYSLFNVDIHYKSFQ